MAMAMRHAVTTAQLTKLVEAIGDGKGFPKITDDPYVNYLVDCVVNYQCDPSDEEEEFNPELYPANEYKALK